MLSLIAPLLLGVLTPVDPPALRPGFTWNVGQHPAAVRAVSRRGDWTAFVVDDGLVLHLDGGSAGAAAVRLSVVDVAADACVQAVGAPSGRAHIYRGSDPDAWHEQIPVHASVAWRGVRPGVDLRVYEGTYGLEYDVLLAPGVAATTLAMRCEGVERLELLAPGRLVMHTPVGDIVQHLPAAWQPDADGTCHPVDARFVLLDEHVFGFEVSGADPELGVVVDPGLAFATLLGGNLRDLATAVGVGEDGDVWIAGQTSSASFPTTIGPQLPTGLADTFVARLDPIDGLPLFSTLIGGNDQSILAQETAMGLALQGEQVVVTGRAASADFPTTPGAFQESRPGAEDGFVARLAADGALLWSTYLGGGADDRPRGISVNAAGLVGVVGSTTSLNYPLTPGAFDDTKASPFFFADAFASVLSADGSALVASTYLGSDLIDIAFGCQLADDGTLVLVGQTGSGDFPTTVGAFDQTYNGANGTQRDGFVCRLSAAGDALLFGTFLGGPGIEELLDVVVDEAGDLLVCGVARDGNVPLTPGALQDTFGGGLSDGWIARLSGDGATLGASTLLGGSGEDVTRALAVGPTGAGMVTVVGYSDSTDLPVSAGTPAAAGVRDAFVARLPAGDVGTLLFGARHGGADTDEAHGVALDDVGGAWVVGETMSVDAPVTDGSTNAGAGDVLVLRFDLPPWTDLGLAKTGSNGLDPRLVGTGPLTERSLGALVLHDGPPSTLAILFVGLSAGSVPFKGGTLVPFPIALQVSLGTFPDGSLLLPFLWPTNIPAGLPFIFQVWMSDPRIPGKTTASNGLEGIAG